MCAWLAAAGSVLGKAQQRRLLLGDSVETGISLPSEGEAGSEYTVLGKSVLTYSTSRKRENVLTASCRLVTQSTSWASGLPVPISCVKS